jgi:glycosyltransferase involved in cell wall biosynthesis
MHIAHITLEDVASGLFRTQVLTMAQAIARRDPSVRIDLHVINRPWCWHSHERVLADYARQLVDTRVRIRYTSTLPPLRHALMSAAYSRAVTWSLRAVLLPYRWSRADVLHSRSYWPAMALHGLGLRNVVFDPRSLWVSENISTGDLVPNSAAHRYWLAAERECVELAAATTVVSAAMADYYRDVCSVDSAELVPISFEPEIFRFDADARACRRRELGWDGARIFVYSGSLGMSGVNVSALQSLFASTLSDPAARLLFLTGESKSMIDTSLATAGNVVDRVHVVRPKAAEMGQWLSAGDIGVHALPKQLDWATRLGTKVVEYWACGLPVIVNEHVGAAASYIQAENLGRVVELGAGAEAFRAAANAAVALDRGRISQFALRTFATDVIADRYLDVYRAVAAARRR